MLLKNTLLISIDRYIVKVHAVPLRYPSIETGGPSEFP